MPAAKESVAIAEPNHTERAAKRKINPADAAIVNAQMLAGSQQNRLYETTMPTAAQLNLVCVEVIALPYL